MNFHTTPTKSLHPFSHFSIIKKFFTQHVDPNDITITVYNNEYRRYLSHTPAKYPTSYHAMLSWIKRSLNYTPPTGTVLEIGSATPRDARFIRSQGYEVQCSDAAPNFVAYMNSVGEPAISFNIIRDKTVAKYDMVFANAVFPHFTDTEISTALNNIHDILNSKGIVSFNVKQGYGEMWIQEKTISKRYINFQQPDTIRALIEKSGFEIISLDENCVGDPITHIWIRIIARKI